MFLVFRYHSTLPTPLFDLESTVIIVFIKTGGEGGKSDNSLGFTESGYQTQRNQVRLRMQKVGTYISGVLPPRR